LNENQIIENYLILLIGAEDDPIPSREHLQKELFILSKANPKLNSFFKFEKHYEGPFSRDIAELIQEPLFYVNAFNYGRSISLTPSGKKIYQELVKKYSKDKKFRDFISLIKMVRKLYDILTVKELLLLIYLTYPSYKEHSSLCRELMKPSVKNKLLKNLLSKGRITEERFQELVQKNG